MIDRINFRIKMLSLAGNHLDNLFWTRENIAFDDAKDYLNELKRRFPEFRSIIDPIP
jgi:hypothetical protein